MWKHLCETEVVWSVLRNETWLIKLHPISYSRQMWLQTELICLWVRLFKRLWLLGCCLYVLRNYKRVEVLNTGIFKVWIKIVADPSPFLHPSWHSKPHAPQHTHIMEAEVGFFHEFIRERRHLCVPLEGPNYDTNLLW